MPQNTTAENVHVSGFKLDDVIFQLSPGQSMTIPEICKKYGIKRENTVFILNGTALTAGQAAKTKVSGGDRVEVSRAAKGGC